MREPTGVMEMFYLKSRGSGIHMRYIYFFSLILFIYFFPFISISWRPITLQYCSGFCHTLTWISHRFTCVPHPEPLSHLPPHPIPLGHPRLYGRRSGWDDLREEYRNMYIIKCETDRQSRLDAWDKCSEIYILLSKLYTWKSVHFIAN